MNKVAIIIPTYNGAAYLPRFFDTLHATTESDAVGLIVVDNNSNDGTPTLVKRLAPEATLIENTENRGFAGACNQGMRYALDKGFPYVMLANQDLSFSDGWLLPLLETLANDARVAAVQPLILMYPQTDTINSCGNELHFLGFGYTSGYLQKRGTWDCAYRELAYCSGAAVVYRASALQCVGLFDETYFMYHEDSDLCWRLRLAGSTAVVDPCSVVYHQYEFSRSITKFYYIERNRYLNLFKNYRLRTLILLMPIFFFWEAGLLTYSILSFFSGKKTLGLKEKFAAYAYFFLPSTWRHIAAERRKIKTLRTVSDREIAKLFTSVIEFQDVASPLLDRVANPITKAYWKCIRHLL